MPTIDGDMSNYGISSLSIIPARAEPDDRSEMTTQILFGEAFTILEEQEKWIKIYTANDHYECWIGRKQILPLSEQSFRLMANVQFPLVADLIDLIAEPRGGSFPVVIGSQLPNYSNGKLFLENEEFFFDGNCIIPETIPDRNKLLETAFMFINAPYLWGGRSPFGIDCSGFTQMTYRMNGIQLPRDAKDQALLGRPLSFLEESQPGDLAFFDNEEGKIIHVGIILANHRIIHASGNVRIDFLDHQGIFHSAFKTYTHHLRVIKSFF
jgi:hypothetical protein